MIVPMALYRIQAIISLKIFQNHLNSRSPIIGVLIIFCSCNSSVNNFHSGTSSYFSSSHFTIENVYSLMIFR